MAIANGGLSKMAISSAGKFESLPELSFSERKVKGPFLSLLFLMFFMWLQFWLKIMISKTTSSHGISKSGKTRNSFVIVLENCLSHFLFTRKISWRNFSLFNEKHVDFFRPCRISPFRIPSWWLRKRGETLHATLATRSDQYRSFTSTLFYTFSVP